MRIALGLEYRGTNYAGWQKQAGLKTVQSLVEEALSKVSDRSVEIFCSGRTDKGVHAYGQVIHFDSIAERRLYSWLSGGNRYLPTDIRIQWVNNVPPEFHARFSAYARHYRYLIYNHNVPSAIWHESSAFHYLPLNAELMQKGANYLIGEHDFSSYRGAKCEARTPIRNVLEIKVRSDKRFIIIDIIANAFLLHMVRNIVGVLLEIGNEKHPPIWAEEVLLGKDRNLGGITAPASGLYLMAVYYPEKYQLPKINNDQYLHTDFNEITPAFF